MCNTSRTASNNSKFLVGEIFEISKILMKSVQSLRVKSLDSLVWRFKLSIINNCHGLNTMCLKFNTASLSLSYLPSTVVTGSFRPRKFSVYPKVADFTDKKPSKSNM